MTQSETPKYKSIAAAWISENQQDGSEYLVVKFETDQTFKAGDKLYLSANKYKNDNPLAPDYKKVVKDVQDTPKPTQTYTKQKSSNEDDLPF